MNPKGIFPIICLLTLLVPEPRAQSQGVAVRTTNGSASSLTVKAPSASIPLTVVTPLAGQNADIIQIRDDTGVILGRIDGNGGIFLNGTGYFTNSIHAIGDSTVVGNFTDTGGQFNGSGAGLTALNAGNLSSGTVADARLSANVPLLNAGQTFTGANVMNNAGNSFTGNGSALTSLNAANLSSGVAPVARLGTGSGSATTFLNGTGAFSAVGGAASAHPLGMLFVSTNTWGITNSTQQISVFGTNNGVGTLTLATGDMNVGTRLRIDVKGPYGVGTGDTLGLAFVIGNTVIYTNSFAFGVNTAQEFEVEVDIIFRAVGASGTVICQGNATVDALSTLSIKGTATTVDTTASRKVDCLILWGSAVSNVSFTSDIAEITYAP